MFRKKPRNLRLFDIIGHFPCLTLKKFDFLSTHCTKKKNKEDMHAGKKALIHPKQTPIFKHGTIDTKINFKPPFTSQTAGSRAGVNPRADIPL